MRSRDVPSGTVGGRIAGTHRFARSSLAAMSSLPLRDTVGDQQQPRSRPPAVRVEGVVKRFGSVTVLNGHIHQIAHKVEGNITFHTARSTGFPQPEPGKAPAPGPLKNVAAEKLRAMLGLTSVSYVAGRGPLAVVDTALG